MKAVKLLHCIFNVSLSLHSVSHRCPLSSNFQKIFYPGNSCSSPFPPIDVFNFFHPPSIRDMRVPQKITQHIETGLRKKVDKEFNKNSKYKRCIFWKLIEYLFIRKLRVPLNRSSVSEMIDRSAKRQLGAK